MKGIRKHFTLPDGQRVEKTSTGYRQYSKEFPYSYTETNKTLAQLIEDASPNRYATIKRGKVKLLIGSDQDKYLHFKNLPHSHVTIKDGIKRIKRY